MTLISAFPLASQAKPRPCPTPWAPGASLYGCRQPGMPKHVRARRWILVSTVVLVGSQNLDHTAQRSMMVEKGGKFERAGWERSGKPGKGLVVAAPVLLINPDQTPQG